MQNILPDGFLASMKDAPGFDADAFVQVHESGRKSTSIRINPFKISGAELPFTGTRNIPWCSNGYYLPERPSFTIDPLFHAGAYYVQEASSMFLEQALAQLADLSKPLHVLDLCAAPGGKSTHILSLISPDSLLVSNEIIQSRVHVLTENISKWGPVNVVVTGSDPKEFQKLGSFFDVIVVDAPCSGSGLFRKDPAAADEWSQQAVQLCSQRQQRILADVICSLKPGGLLIYSTCSYSIEEDEDMGDWLVKEFGLQAKQIAIDPAWGVFESGSSGMSSYGYRFYPDKLDGEGFFLSAFIKEGRTDDSKSFTSKKGNRKSIKQASAQEIKEVGSRIKLSAGTGLFSWNDSLFLFPTSLSESLHELQQYLYIKKAGLKAGMMARNDFIPDHELAMSHLLNDDIPSIELSHENALQYLRRSDVNIQTDLRGWVLVTYRKVPLGWVKVLPNRINNYYPKDWRILNK